MAERDEKPMLTLAVFEDGTGEVMSADGSFWPLDRAEVANFRDAMEKADSASAEGAQDA